MNTESKDKKTKKPPKPAALYRKPIEERAFQKKYLRYIELEKDRALLEASFDFSDGRYSLKEGLDRPTILRLNALAKAIKGNRGVVKTGPAILAVILASSGVVFGLFFMNPLLERSIERALEAAFGARAEVTGFRLRPWNLSASMAAVSVADRDAPMTNLFETGSIELRMNPAALIRGRVYVEEASAASLAVGTPRTVSGTLPGLPPETLPEKPPKVEGPPLVDFENFDAAALLEREKSKLKSTAAYAEAAAAYEAAVVRWKDRSGATRKTVESLGGSAKAFLATDPKSLKTLEAISAAAAEAKTIGERARDVAADAEATAEGIRAEAENAARLERAARASVDEDIAHLKSYVDPKSGAAMEALDPAIREIVSDKVERYLYYGKRALAAAQKLKETDAAQKKMAPKNSGGGRDVAFPSAELPRFRLGLLASSFSAGDQDWKVELRELSSEPDLVASPTTLSVSVSGGGRSLEADAAADLRSSAAEAYTVDAAGDGLPVDLGEALKDLGIGGFTGKAAFSASLKGAPDGSAAARSTVAVGAPRVLSPKGTLAAAVAEAAAKADTIRLELDYRKARGHDAALDIDTNLDKLVADAVRAVAERYAKKAAAEVEKALREYAGKELAGKLPAKDELNALASAASGDKQAAARLKDSVDAKKAELENRAKSLAEEAAKKAVGEAAKKAAEAIKKADLPIPVPKVSPPKIKF